MCELPEHGLQRGFGQLVNLPIRNAEPRVQPSNLSQRKAAPVCDFLVGGLCRAIRGYSLGFSFMVHQRSGEPHQRTGNENDYPKGSLHWIPRLKIKSPQRMTEKGKRSTSVRILYNWKDYELQAQSQAILTTRRIPGTFPGRDVLPSRIAGFRPL
jgi:hypothetical protein